MSNKETHYCVRNAFHLAGLNFPQEYEEEDGRVKLFSIMKYCESIGLVFHFHHKREGRGNVNHTVQKPYIIIYESTNKGDGKPPLHAEFIDEGSEISHITTPVHMLIELGEQDE